MDIVIHLALPLEVLKQTLVLFALLASFLAGRFCRFIHF